MNPSDSWHRRAVLKAVATGGIASLAGCSSGSNDPNDNSSDGDGPDGTGSGNGGNQGFTRGGTLRLGTRASFNSLNGLISDSGSEQALNGFLHAHLVQVNPDLSLSPEIATDWEANDDATKWTFQVRNDFTFHHNGKKLLAEDVAGTINAIFAEDSKATGKGNLGPVKNAEVVNDGAVQLNLSRPDGIMPTRMGMTWAPIYPKDVAQNRWDEMATKDFGAGPFKLDNFASGDIVEMSAYEDYPQKDDQGNAIPYLGGITMQQMPDASTMTTSFLNKDLDLLWQVPLSQFSRLEGEQQVNARQTKVSSFPVIVMRSDKKPFDDVKVRNAFKWALNRESLVAGGLNGYGFVANDTPVGPTYPTYTELETQRTQNLEKAANLLEEAGYGEGGEKIELKYKAPSDPQWVLDTTVVAAKQFNNLPNVNVEVVQQSYDTWISQTWLKSRFYTSWYGQDPRAATQLKIAWHSDGAWNEAHWSNENFDEALDMAMASTSTEEQTKHLKTCSQILWEQGPTIIPTFRNMLTGNWNYVKGYEPSRDEAFVVADKMWMTEDAPTQN